MRSSLLGAGLLLSACAPVAYVQAPAQVYASAPPPAPVYYPEAPAQPAVANPLDQLMAPIALYPDPLISLILPAATFPSDIAAAGAYLSQGGDAAQVDLQPWDPSVRALAHYPSVVTWMAQNEPWTQTVGAAFVSQPADIMAAIQRLRELARAAGTLTDNREQRVVVDEDSVEIEPAEEGVIYVPQYDPTVVFVDQPYYGFNGPFLAFGPPYPAGEWLTFGCNWRGGAIVVVGADYWHGGGGWWHPNGSGRGGADYAGYRVWGFPAGRPRPEAVAGWQSHEQRIQPRLIAGTPAQPPRSAFQNIRTRGPAAVAAVAKNPNGFKGRALNTAILAKPAYSAPSGRGPGGPATAARPLAGAEPGTRVTAATQPAAAPPRPASQIGAGKPAMEPKAVHGKPKDKKGSKPPLKKGKPAVKQEPPKPADQTNPR
jgi:hypothetical protein